MLHATTVNNAVIKLYIDSKYLQKKYGKMYQTKKNKKNKT